MDKAVPRLRRSDCAAPGIARRRRGRGFEYRDPALDRVEDPEVLERIATLAIPPAWQEVWICMDSRGHLQATGVDAAGRKQYLYHERWRVHRDRLKFDSMIAFGEMLPRLRRRLKRDLASTDGEASSGVVSTSGETSESLSRERVFACSVRLLDLGFFRIGSEDYAERNESYGLTTMLKRHVSIEDGEVLFDYTAKSGVRRVQAIADHDVLEVIAALKRRRGGKQLLAYREGRHWSEIHAEALNAYIKQVSGGDFTAKDFRTWNATVLTAVALASVEEQAKSQIARRRAINSAVKTVATYLGNTPAVCRASYIDPRVIDHYQSASTIAPALEQLPKGPDLANARTRAHIETAVLKLLADEPAAQRAARH